jgi:hypothetical protein
VPEQVERRAAAERNRRCSFDASASSTSARNPCSNTLAAERPCTGSNESSTTAYGASASLSSTRRRSTRRRYHLTPRSAAVREHIEFGSHVAMQNSNAQTDEQLHPLRHVARWTWPGEQGKE